MKEFGPVYYPMYQESVPTENVVKRLLQRFPDLNLLPSERPQVNPRLFYPRNFDDLSEHSQELQSFTATISRSQEVQEQYERFKTEHPNFLSDMKQRLGNNDAIIAIDEFPAQVPSDVVHCNLFFREDLSVESLAQYLSIWLVERNLSPEEVVIVMNPKFKQSVPSVSHYHLFVHTEVLIK